MTPTKPLTPAAALAQKASANLAASGGAQPAPGQQSTADKLKALASGEDPNAPLGAKTPGDKAFSIQTPHDPNGTMHIYAKNAQDAKAKYKQLGDPLGGATQAVEIKEDDVEESSDSMAQNRLWKMISDYEKRAKETKNDIKRDHYMKMAQQLRGKLKTNEDYSPMAKDSMKQDKIRSLKNLIAIAKEQGRKLRVQELELELKKLQGVEEAVLDPYRKSTSNTNSSPELRGINIPGNMKHPDWREPTWSFTEVAEKLGVSPKELQMLALQLGSFPKKSEGLKSQYGSKAYYPRSEIKRWVNSSGVRDIIKAKKGVTEGSAYQYHVVSKLDGNVLASYKTREEAQKNAHGNPVVSGSIETIGDRQYTREQGVAEAIPYALSAANSNAEFERTRTHIPRGYKGRVDTEVSSQEEYTAVMHVLNKLARAEGQHVECGLSGDKMSIISKTMDSGALDEFVDMALEEFDQGVAEGLDPDTKRLEQDVRDALDNGDDYTAKQYAKMAPTPEAKKYLLNIIAQAMYLDDLGGETDWKGVAETNVSKYKDIGATNNTTHFIKNVTTGKIVSPHRSLQDAQDALVGNERGSNDKFKIVRARKGVAEGRPAKGKELAASINKANKDRKDPERYSNREFLDKVDQKMKDISRANDYKKFAEPHIKEQSVAEAGYETPSDKIAKKLEKIARKGASQIGWEYTQKDDGGSLAKDENDPFGNYKQGWIQKNNTGVGSRKSSKSKKTEEAMTTLKTTFEGMEDSIASILESFGLENGRDFYIDGTIRTLDEQVAQDILSVLADHELPGQANMRQLEEGWAISLIGQGEELVENLTVGNDDVEIRHIGEGVVRVYVNHELAEQFETGTAAFKYVKALQQNLAEADQELMSALSAEAGEDLMKIDKITEGWSEWEEKKASYKKAGATVDGKEDDYTVTSKDGSRKRYQNTKTGRKVTSLPPVEGKGEVDSEGNKVKRGRGRPKKVRESLEAIRAMRKQVNEALSKIDRLPEAQRNTPQVQAMVDRLTESVKKAIARAK